MSWRTRWKLRDYVRNSIWIVPLLFVALAIALGLLLPDIDERTQGAIGVAFGASSAQGILGTMAGGMITFTGFVFSILLLAVQFGSSQFSPRMLRRFLRDPTTKISLGMFMATFIYALLVLRKIEPSNNTDFIPDISVSVSIFMLLASMLMFLRLISRTTQGLRVAAVLSDLGRDGAKVIERLYPDPFGEGEVATRTPEQREEPTEADRHITYSQRPGILQALDARGIVKLAREADATIELVPSIGDLAVPGEPLFRVLGDEGGTISDEHLRGSVAVGDERTITQDPAFVFRLLADISAKALSPGVNDPTTSAQALDQIELLLRLLVGRRLGPGELRSADGRVRFRYPTPSWEDFLSIALDETRAFGADSAQIVRRLRALLEDLLVAAPAERKTAIEAQLAALQTTVEESYAGPVARHFAATRDRQGIGSPSS